VRRRRRSRRTGYGWGAATGSIAGQPNDPDAYGRRGRFSRGPEVPDERVDDALRRWTSASSTRGMPSRPGALGRRRADAEHERWHRQRPPSGPSGPHRPGRGGLAVNVTASAGHRSPGAPARVAATAPSDRPRRGAPPSPSPPNRREWSAEPGRRTGTGPDSERAGRELSGTRPTNPSALCSAGTRSGSTPVRRNASAVAGPTAATRVEPNARASRSSPMKRLTALTDVKTTQR
jgi:hypothetical protein